MNKIITRRLLFVMILSLLPVGYLFGQKTLNHEVFLEKIKNSGENTYKECIKEYDAYLKKNPDDVSVLVEKCKFIQYAQYDYDEDYNPNQEEFDSCTNDLVSRFTTHPEVILFQTTYLYGKELREVLKKGEKSIKKNPEQWSTENSAALYKASSDEYYSESDYKHAYLDFERAISFDKKYKSDLDYVRVLIKLNKNKKALKALLAAKDSVCDAWTLSQKAYLFMQLQAYPDAMEMYERIEALLITITPTWLARWTR